MARETATLSKVKCQINTMPKIRAKTEQTITVTFFVLIGLRIRSPHAEGSGMVSSSHARKVKCPGQANAF